jgi:hypothetical protein
VSASETFEILDHQLFHTKSGLSLQILNVDFSAKSPATRPGISTPAVNRTTINVLLKFKEQAFEDFFVVGSIGTVTRDHVEWANFRISLLKRRLKNNNWITTFHIEKLEISPTQ